MSSERRERRGFEPPPWEKEQFDELQRRKAEEEAAPVAEEPAEAGLQGQDGSPVPAEQAEEPAGAAPDLASAVPEVKPQGEAGDGQEISQAQMMELMAGLRSEDPPATGVWKLGLAVAAFMAVLGAVLIMWGIVALMATRGAGELGWMGSAVLIIFGAGSIAVAGWTAYKNLQRQGVL